MSDPHDTPAPPPSPNPPTGGEPPKPEPASAAPAYSVEPEVPTARLAKPSLGSSSLIDGFEEDADFSKDPAVDAALGKLPAARIAEPGPLDDRPLFVRPGFPAPKTLVVVGGLLLIVALVMTAINAPNHPIARVALTLYRAVVFTGTGIVAVLASAMILERRPGKIDLAAARVFACVGGFLSIFTMNLNWLSGKFEEMVLAAAMYSLLAWLLFRLDRVSLAVLVGSHFLISALVLLGMELSAYVSAPTS